MKDIIFFLFTCLSQTNFFVFKVPISLHAFPHQHVVIRLFRLKHYHVSIGLARLTLKLIFKVIDLTSFDVHDVQLWFESCFRSCVHCQLSPIRMIFLNSSLGNFEQPCLNVVSHSLEVVLCSKPCPKEVHCYSLLELVIL